MVDFDGDGQNDILTGSYWPGHFYLFRGRSDGTFEKAQILEDAKGEKLHAGGTWTSDREPDMDSLAAVPIAVDFDGDGDLDLLVGNIAGRVILIPNEGTAKKPAFNREKRRAIQAGGKDLKVEGDSGPGIADWDQDGTPDLLVGAGDGAVLFFRNTGKKDAPVYAEGVELLPKSKFGYEGVEKPESPGSRTKVHVTDWDGDGRVDLLVGDIWYEKAPELKLTEEQKKRRDELKAKQKELNEKWQELYDRDPKDPKIEELGKEFSKIYGELSKLEPSSTPRGSVWLYLRKKK